jgi:hypothetical protein
MRRDKSRSGGGFADALTCEGVTYNACGWVYCPAQCVDGDNVWCLLIPGPILPPVARRDFFP